LKVRDGLLAGVAQGRQQLLLLHLRGSRGRKVGFAEMMV
jgi:hypothetical protein